MDEEITVSVRDVRYFCEREEASIGFKNETLKNETLKNETRYKTARIVI